MAAHHGTADERAAKRPRPAPLEEMSRLVSSAGATAGDALVLAQKAYRNDDFLNSQEARLVRILCEFEETRQRLWHNGIEGTLLFFGSARSLTPEEHRQEVTAAEAQLAECLAHSPPDAAGADRAKAKLTRLARVQRMCSYCTLAEVLAERLTAWTMAPDVRRGRVVVRHVDDKYLAPGHGRRPAAADLQGTAANSPTVDEEAVSAEGLPQQYVVCTGGGPGLMEAANRGARRVEGARTMGMGISLPFEKGLNRHVTPELAFSFHYFFTRKFWMLYLVKAIIVCPGGFGTLDELFETAALRQAGKLPPRTPIVLLGREFWAKVINLPYLIQCGFLTERDVDGILITDDQDEAFAFVTKALTAPSD